MLSVDLSREGKSEGAIVVPHSTNESGAGRIEIPVISIRNGEGPRVLCTAGVHGDEFEGQIFLSRLARALEPQQVNGHLIIVPAVNLPSATASLRCSPIDGLNLNRIFPGNTSGSVTERIAYTVEHDLIAGSDYMLDLHGGGNTLLFHSGPTVTRSEDPALMASQLELLRAFGAPRAYIFDESGGGSGGTLGACRRHNVVRMGTEIGGGGHISPADLAMMTTGTLRVLVHIGVLDPKMAADLPPAGVPVINRRPKASTEGYIYAEEDGLFIPAFEVGEPIAKGQRAGEILWPERPMKSPVPVIAEMDGFVLARRKGARTLRGDCLFMLGEPEPI